MPNAYQDEYSRISAPDKQKVASHYAVDGAIAEIVLAADKVVAAHAKLQFPYVEMDELRDALAKFRKVSA